MNKYQKILIAIGLFTMSCSIFSIGWVTSIYYKQCHQVKIVKIKNSEYSHNNIDVDISYDGVNYTLDDLSYYELNKLIK